MTEEVKSSTKSKMKKRPADWEALKNEIAEELGLWEKVKKDGWAGLSAAESGRLGGVFSKRRAELDSILDAEFTDGNKDE